MIGGRGWRIGFGVVGLVGVAVSVSGVVGVQAPPAATAPANDDAWLGGISANGRFVVFESGASNLVAGDTNGLSDVFVRDLVTETTMRVSAGSGGRQTRGGSSEMPAISADGRFIVFASGATNLVRRDTNRQEDVFVRDRAKRTTTRVSLSSRGAQLDGPSWLPAISADGRFVAFTSRASNLRGRNANHRWAVFVRDRVEGLTAPVSVSSAGARPNAPSAGAAISADGRYIAFESDATNLVAGDTNKSQDVFVRDRVKGTTERVSVGIAVGQANGRSDGATISGDGRFVAFQSVATNLAGAASSCPNGPCVAVFVRDRLAGTTERVSMSSSGGAANDDSDRAAISASGRLVAFRSLAANLVVGDTATCPDRERADLSSCQRVFLRDRATGTTTLASMTGSGEPLGPTLDAAISADGRFVAFTSFTPAGPGSDYTNGRWDVYVRDRLNAKTTLVSAGR